MSLYYIMQVKLCDIYERARERESIIASCSSRKFQMEVYKFILTDSVNGSPSTELQKLNNTSEFTNGEKEILSQVIQSYR